MPDESIRVLHVDDEPDFAELAATFLERADGRLTVEVATSASDGLDRLTEDEFDCVVSDYDMPRTDGIEFLERVREAYPDLPFILFTGKGSEEIASDAISAGVTDYLQKSGDTSQYELLANRIRNSVDQYRAERHARLQERQYRRLFENAPIMYVLVRDERGRPVIEDCNDRFVEKLGYDREAVIGRPTTDFFTEESARDVYEGGGYERALGGEFELEERTLVTEDGERIETLLRASPRVDEHGNAIGVQTLYLDVTAHKERERELEEYREYTDRVLDAIDDLFFVHDENGDLQRWNESLAEATGYADEEFASMNGAELVPADHRERAAERIRDVFETGHARLEAPLLTKDGTTIPYEFVADRVERPDGEPRLIGIGRDISERVETEAQLREERNRLSALFEDAPQPTMEGTIETTDHRPIVGVNDAFEETFGYDADEIVGRDIADALVPEAERAEHARLRDRVAAGESFSVQVERTTADGERIFRLDVVTYGTETTPADGWFATYTDITERREREEELELYETMVETVPDGVYVLDEDFRYVAVNQGMADLTGYSKEELIGSHLSLVHTEETRAKAKQGREQLIADGIDDEVIVAKHPHVTADGESIPTEVRFRALPPDDDGSFCGTAGVIRDISERLETEAQLREERNRLSALFEDAPQPIIETEITADNSLPIVGVNDAFPDVFGYDDAEVLGRDVVDVLVPADEQPAHEQIRERGIAGKSLSAEVKRTTTDGEQTFLLDVIPYGTESTPADGAFAIYTDITERYEREQKLQRERNRLDKFASIVSHDLRNPLRVADGKIELAREACDSAHLADAAAALDRMDALIEDVLTVAREGTAVESTEPTDLAAVVEACWGTVDTADATLVVDTEATIRADRGRLQQLLENLVRNAVEHGGTDVTITVGALDGGRGFYVADDGPGIPADEREQVFESGYSNTEAGTGFGLAIVEEIATAHGWNVDVTDSADGGTRVEITGVETVA